MTAVNVSLLVFYAIGMSVGQLLFKLAADDVKAGSARAFAVGLLLNRHFAVAVVVYGVMTVLWVWILTRVPLSRAYPFIALAFVFTPALAFLMFGESVSLRYFIGLTFILAGLIVLVPRAA